MGVVVDVIFAVTEIAITTGAITELQFRMGDICPAANYAAMLVLGFCFLLLFRMCGTLGPALLIFSGEEVTHICAEEEKIVGNRYQGEQVVGETKYRKRCIEDLNGNQNEVDKTHYPGFDGNDEHNEELAVGIQCCKGQQQTQV